MSRRFQFSLSALLVAVCLIGPALLVLPWLAHNLSDLFPMLAKLWSNMGHPDVAGFMLIVVTLGGIILLKAVHDTRKP